MLAFIVGILIAFAIFYFINLEEKSSAKKLLENPFHNLEYLTDRITNSLTIGLAYSKLSLLQEVIKYKQINRSTNIRNTPNIEPSANTFITYKKGDIAKYTIQTLCFEYRTQPAAFKEFILRNKSVINTAREMVDELEKSGLHYSSNENFLNELDDLFLYLAISTHTEYNKVHAKIDQSNNVGIDNILKKYQ